MSNSKQRVALLDEWRGLVIILMVFYHAAYDLVAIIGIDIPFFHSLTMRWLQVFIASSFIIVSGICCRFSRSNLRRGILCFVLGLLISTVTAVVIPSQIVRFGILSLLGSSMILFALLEPLLNRIPTALGAPIFGFFFLITIYLPYGQIGFPPLIKPMPPILYHVKWLFWLGFPSPQFQSSDYFPLFPWLFLFFAASFIGSYLKSGNAPSLFYKSHAPWLCAVGRHTIWIYLLHQPIIYGILQLLFIRTQ